ncbi:hypothetical protein CY35_04G048200 [Sphagnum magellanicum]|nr:hypothetical protein CY35_04G048200 [Sphagnum magellanicum]KAH9564883.1 hypothetical protein CY35_04G048200 [Sphagnum magellanicum]KAH9564884.1 hypothetical protein CY35_04G048200 [Sphagnum magellanicum]
MMAFSNKHGRQERRMPACYVMVTGAVFLAFFLVAVWVFSAPSEVPEEEISLVSDDVTNESSSSDGSSETQVSGDDLQVTTGDSENNTGDISNDSQGGDEEDRLSENGDEQNSESSSSLDRSETEEEDTEKKTDQEDTTTDEDSSAAESEPEEKKSGEETEEPTEEDEKAEEEKVGEKPEEKKESLSTDDDLPVVGAEQADLTTENKEGASSWDTQAKESKTEKDMTDSSEKEAEDEATSFAAEEKTGEDEEQQEEPSSATAVEEEVDEIKTENEAGVHSYEWKACAFEGAQDYIPCLDNREYLAHIATTKHFEHRERHCPDQDAPTCLVPLPAGYKPHIPWPASRDEIWYDNVPHEGLASYKADQNWVKKKSDKLTFPGGGTQFKNGVEHYIEYLEKILPEISWGKHTRVLLDVGCGVASFGGYLFDRDVIAMSFAPKDEHEAQVQMALERGIPAISSVMGTQRLVYPSNVFDVVHCARCRVLWHLDGGLLLLELNRILRPGGLFVWSATPVYQDTEEDQYLWNATIAVTESMGWKMLVKDTDYSTSIGAAIFQKPKDNKLYESWEQESPPICLEDDNPDAAWYVKMTPCIHRIPTTAHSEWPAEWPLRLNSIPAWLSKSDKGLYGNTAPDDFEVDAAHWENVVQKSYLTGLDIDWNNIRNIMDMKADYGGFAAALISQPVWVMNIMPTSEPDTLPIIFDRGLIGMYHDWCEPHSTYPRSYDLLHANHLLSSIDKKCSLENLVLEMDRILRPDGWAIFRDEVEVLKKVQEMVTSLHWDVRVMYTMKGEELLAAQKRFWRPDASA